MSLKRVGLRSPQDQITQKPNSTRVLLQGSIFLQIVWPIQAMHCCSSTYLNILLCCFRQLPNGFRWFSPGQRLDAAGQIAIVNGNRHSSCFQWSFPLPFSIT